MSPLEGPAPVSVSGEPSVTTATPSAPPLPAAPNLAARAEAMLLGLAAGDAAGWPAARPRAARLPRGTRRLTRVLDT
ncbi:ADP-ribosylglycohydrolase family protein, partial [Streptomyces albidoflavus]